MAEADRLPRLRARFSDVGEQTLLQVSSTLFNVALLADFATLVSLPEYEGYDFPPHFWYRFGRPVKDTQRPQVRALTQSSPMLLDLVLPYVVGTGAATTVVWTTIQIAEKIRTWELNRELLRQKVRRETLENDVLELDIEERLERRHDNSLRVMRTLVKRIETQDIPVAALDYDETDEP